MRLLFIAFSLFVVLLKSGTTANAQVTCDQSGGTSPFAVCGNNGGTATQLFTPGSVIILQRSALAKELMSDALELPDFSSEVSRSLKQNASTSSTRGNFLLGDGLYGFSLSVLSADLTEDGPGFDQSSIELSFGRDVTLGDSEFTLSSGVIFSKKNAGELNYEYVVPGFNYTNTIQLGEAKETNLGVFAELGTSRDLGQNTQFFSSGRASVFAIDTSRIVNDSNSGILNGTPGTTFDQVPISGNTYGVTLSGEAGLLRSKRHGNNSVSLLHGLVRASHTYTGGFTETSDISSTDIGNEAGEVAAGDAAFTYSGNRVTQFQSEVGYTFSRPIQTAQRTLFPSFSAAWINDFSSNNQNQTVSVSNEFDGSVSESSTFDLPVSKPDRNYFRIGMGIGAPLERNAGFWSINYETTLGHSYIDDHRVSAILFVEF